jgi:hypothetical protein
LGDAAEAGTSTEARAAAEAGAVEEEACRAHFERYLMIFAPLIDFLTCLVTLSNNKSKKNSNGFFV